MNSLKNNQNQGKNNSPNKSLLPGLNYISGLMFLLGLAMLVRGGSLFNSQANFTNTSETTHNASALMRKSVTIKSRAIEKIGLSSFTISDDRFFSGQPIIVVNASGKAFDLPVEPNVAVQVTGKLRNLVIPEIEREFHLKLEDKSYRKYLNKSAIIARELALVPQISQITKNPQKYYGNNIVVTGKVATIRSSILLTIDKNRWFGGQDLLLLLTAPPQVTINQGQMVSAVGEIRPFVAAEIERDYKFTWSLEAKSSLDAEYGNKPVLVTKTIYPAE
ncbi:hypothetical protein NIES22_56150 [Calothrix brevissima NIES-22]|nr:hypothetical protein NIES22_56150 [Calothrix brevissima NIES-22]